MNGRVEWKGEEREGEERSGKGKERKGKEREMCICLQSWVLERGSGRCSLWCLGSLVLVFQ